MPQEISSAARTAYYQAALRLLRFVEARHPTGRRFGVDADALWKTFAGGLKTSDRIDLLLRDADATWLGALGARATFGLRAVAEDDAFGADWVALDPMEGERMWRACTNEAAPGSNAEAIEAILTAWERTAEAAEQPRWAATTKRVLAGCSAIAAGIRAFADDATLSWADQVLVVADDPAERQLAAAAAAILEVNQRPTRLRGSAERERG